MCGIGVILSASLIFEAENSNKKSSTGMKCLPANQAALLDSGTVLHDWHAEILAIRAFNHFLLQEAYLLASTPTYASCILRRREAGDLTGPLPCPQRYGLHEDLKILMYCSEAPCGDASMELVMEAQDDSTPWPVVVPNENGKQTLLGRGSFSQLGLVRRKPCKWLLLMDFMYHFS